jgi:hypothetical protein
MFECPSCHQNHTVETQFCPVTGHSIQAVLTCSTCNEKIAADWKVCPACRASLDPEPVKSESQPAFKLENSRLTTKKKWAVSGIVLLVCLPITFLILYFVTGKSFSISQLWQSRGSPFVSDEASKSTPFIISAGRTTPKSTETLYDSHIPILSVNICLESLIS